MFDFDDYENAYQFPYDIEDSLAQIDDTKYPDFNNVVIMAVKTSSKQYFVNN